MDNEHAHRLTEAIRDFTHVFKHQTERLNMNVKDATDALNNLSTASDGLSVKVDHLVEATTGLISALGNATLTPEQEAAVTKAQAAVAAAETEGDKVDAAVAAADKVLPTPAPAAPTA